MESLKGFKMAGAIVVLVNFMHGGGSFGIIYLTIYLQLQRHLGSWRQT
jgi:hypothetical protein